LSSVRPGNNLALFLAARAISSSITPAWSRWIAHGRIGFMSTQRRDGHSAPTTETGRRSVRLSQNQSWCISKPPNSSRRDPQGAATPRGTRIGHFHSGFAVGSRHALCRDLQDRAYRLGPTNAALLTWSFPAADAPGRVIYLAAHLPAMAAPSALQQDTRSWQPVRSFCPGSPPVRQAAAPSPFFNAHPPIPFPAVFARVHPTLPHVPVARRGGPCRTERYDGKGNLYFKHAA
jgi:hypothetical protein